MTPARYFLWVSDESRSAELQSQGARVCDGCVAMHHASWAILHELPESLATSLSKTQGDAR